MRQGQNPAKSVDQVAKPERITVAVLNYIPFVSGFFAKMPEVLNACLTSLRNDPGLPFDLLVFDNGSCREVQEYLLDERTAGRIQYLLLSEKNLGKGGAWNIIFNAAPGEIVAYADNDVYFYPGWLARSVEILETYPKAGMVTARPFVTKNEFLTSTFSWMENQPDLKMEKGNLIPIDDYRAFGMSIGHSAESAVKGYAEAISYKATYKNVEAFVGASHWQFSAYKSVIQQFLPFDMSKPMRQVIELDRKINDAGFLRLMVSDPLAMNMSNTPILTSNRTDKDIKKKKASIIVRLREIGVIKKSLLALYDLIFHWYYRE
jgi:glycosyltransferase involved in cell wall biosynthesis